jgi:hypothetical protein
LTPCVLVAVFIEGVRQITDPNSYPPGLHQNSLVVQTPDREIKITAPTRERHEMWFNVGFTISLGERQERRLTGLPPPPQAINYLLTRPQTNIEGAGAGGMPSPAQRRNSVANIFASPGMGATYRDTHTLPRRPTSPNFSTPREKQEQAQMYLQSSASEPRLTPRSQSRHAHFPYKRSGTPAAEFLEATAEFGSPRSPRISSPTKIGGAWDESLQIVDPSDVEYGEGDLADDDDNDSMGGFDGVENVRACCNGAHSLNELSQSARKRHMQHHHHHHHHNRTGSFSEPDFQPTEEASPSLRARKSLKSRTSAATFNNPPPSPTKGALTRTVSSLRAAR